VHVKQNIGRKTENLKIKLALHHLNTI